MPIFKFYCFDGTFASEAHFHLVLQLECLSLLFGVCFAFGAVEGLSDHVTVDILSKCGFVFVTALFAGQYDRLLLKKFGEGLDSPLPMV